MNDFRTIDREMLARRLVREPPNNEDRSQGYALVNVLDANAFARAHIPGSTNIPAERLEAFEKRYAKDKEIVLYCASSECQASEQAASQLVSRGFQRVVDYAAGLRDWRQAGGSVEGAKA